MADILNRLLLDTKDFDNRLRNSKKGVNDYQSNVTNMAKTAGSSILKFAGAFGVAVTASEAFTKTINSSQTTGDAWVKMQDQMKAGVDSFFASIAMGNFDSFLSNLQNVIDKAGDLSVALDDLGTKTLFNNSEVNALNTQYQLELNAAKARNISDEERNAHLAKAKGYLLEMAKLQGSLASANRETSYTALQAEIAKQGFSGNVAKETWDFLLKDSNRWRVDNHAAKYNNTVEDYENKISRSRRFDTKTETYVDTPETIALKKQLDTYKKTRVAKFGELTSIFIQLADDEKSTVASALKMRDTANNLAVSISQKKLEIANTDAKINGSYNKQNDGGGGGNKRTTPPPSGSIAAINEEIAAKNKELINATTMQARIAVQTTINELEAKKISLQIEIDKGIFKAEHGNNKLGNALLSDIAGVINPDTEKTKGAKGFDPKSIKNIKTPVSKNDVNLLGEYQEGLYGISQAMGYMANATGEGAAAWLSWGSSILNAVAQAIPAIKQMIPALTAKAGGEAIAGSAASGPLGWITAGAAVASIIAAFASLPKFANGGIIQGGSTFGDMNLARVNAGEMILNGIQQRKLFNLLDGRESTSSNIGGPVRFIIKGKDLEGVLTNVSNQKRRVR